MRRPLLKPKWLAGHLLALIAIITFVLLGFWQLRRHDEKVELREAVAEAIDGPVVPLADAGPGAFHRVAVSGRYDAGFEQLVPRSRDGASGYEVVTPMLVTDRMAILVDRGWIGIDEPVPPPPDVITGEGVLWPAESGAVADSFNEFAPRIDPASLESFTDYSLRPEYLVLTEQDPDFDIAAPPVREVSLGPHLGYAGQWFLFAAVVAIGYPILLRRRAGGEPDSR